MLSVDSGLFILPYLIYFIGFLNFIHMDISVCLHTCVVTMCVSGTLDSQKRVSDSL